MATKESMGEDLQCEFEYCSYAEQGTDVLTRIDSYSFGSLWVCLACEDGFKDLPGELDN